MGINGKALQLHPVYIKPYFYYKSRKNLYQYCRSHENPYQYCRSYENPYQVPRLTCTASERAIKVEGLYDKIIVTIVPSYTWKNITHLLPLALLLVLRAYNNTDSNKLVIFSGIALYYGDTYIIDINIYPSALEWAIYNWGEPEWVPH